jgi:2-polyprenyl-6-methoxyphenol hydroxylase-like FAD-dependent oxidoreductase
VLTRQLAIVGAGPAGLAAAVLLHDAGFGVTLFERFEQAGPVGSGLVLQPTGLAVLQQMQLRASIEALGHRIDAMHGRIAPAGRTVLDIRYSAVSDSLYGVAIHRASLFSVLFSAVQARGIEMRTDHCIDSIEHRADGKVSLINGNGAQLTDSFDLIIDASGAGSRLKRHALTPAIARPLEYGALWATVGTRDTPFTGHRLEQRYTAARIMAGVLPCGVMPESDDRQSRPLATYFWSMRNSDYAAFQRAGLAAFCDQALAVWPQTEPLLAQIDSIDQLVHARYVHHTLLPPMGKSIAFIGDAAHSTSPQLGQGANMALLDALALTAALQTKSDLHQALLRYCAIRRRHVRFYQLASLALTPFYQSDSVIMPAIRDLLFGPASRMPGGAGLVTWLGAGLWFNPLADMLPAGFDKPA